jgi:hypothetical protein
MLYIVTGKLPRQRASTCGPLRALTSCGRTKPNSLACPFAERHATRPDTHEDGCRTVCVRCVIDALRRNIIQRLCQGSPGSKMVVVCPRGAIAVSRCGSPDRRASAHHRWRRGWCSRHAVKNRHSPLPRTRRHPGVLTCSGKCIGGCFTGRFGGAARRKAAPYHGNHHMDGINIAPQSSR